MVPLGLVGEVFEVRTQVDCDLTTVSRVDRRLRLIKNLGRHNQTRCHVVIHGRTVPTQNLPLHRDATATTKRQGLKRCHHACCGRANASDSRQRPRAPRANNVLIRLPRHL
jgi:hypothetical protein